VSKKVIQKSLGLDQETYDDLTEISAKNFRSKRDQIRKWIAEERKNQELNQYTKAVSLNINKRNENSERGLA